MKSLTLEIIGLASTGLLLLGACSKEAKTSDSTAKPQIEATTPAPKKEPIASNGQSGKYHLELVPEKEGSNTHLDFYLLQGDKHEIVPNAKVTADLQSPDGKQKTLAFNYDAKDKHYTAMVDDKSTGQYQVKVTATFGGEKVDGRFNFDR
jgi:hypothetical protein